MGEAKHRHDEIEAAKAAAAEQAKQQQLMAYMTKQQATYVNGIYMSTAGRMARLVFLETSTPAAPSEPRFAAVMHPEDLEQFLEGGRQLLAAMKAQGDAAAQTPTPEPNAEGEAVEAAA